MCKEISRIHKNKGGGIKFMYIGNHLASSKGLEIMGKEAISLGANTFAFSQETQEEDLQRR